MTPIAAIDTGALLKIIAASLLIGVGVTAAFSMPSMAGPALVSFAARETRLPEPHLRCWLASASPVA